MKLKLKMMAIAAALASLAGGAQADISTDNTQNGSMVLTVFNQLTKAWYIRDLGFTIDTFLPTGIAASVGGAGSLLVGNRTPEAGLQLNAGNTANFGDAAWGSWFSAQIANDLRWNVTAGDNLLPVARMITSSANLSETATNGQVTNFASSSNYGSAQGLFNPATLSRFDSTGANPYQTSLDSNFLLGADGLATSGQDVGLFYFARISGTTGAAANGGAFGNSLNKAVVSLAANGDFSYTLAPAAVAAIPLPAAVWMMGAGLMAIGGMVRRRKAAAQA